MGKYDYGTILPQKGPIRWAFESVQKESEVLELGCANGLLTRYLESEKNCKIDIVEIDEISGMQAATHARKSFLGNEYGDLERDTWYQGVCNNRYDYILLIDVIEHLRNPKDVLAKCRNLLKENGAVLLSVPNIGHNAVLVNLYRNRFEYQELGIMDKTHLRFFTQSSLNSLLKDSGFVVTGREVNIESMEDSLIRSGYHQVPKTVAHALRHRRNGLVVQYLVEAKTEGDSVPFIDIRESLEECNIYDGPSNEGKLVVNCRLEYDRPTQLTIDKKWIKSKSFTLSIASKGCVLENIKAYVQSDNQIQIPIATHNGIGIKNGIVFYDPPELIFNCESISEEHSIQIDIGSVDLITNEILETHQRSITELNLQVEDQLKEIGTVLLAQKDELRRVNEELNKVGAWGQKTAAELEAVNREKAELLREIERISAEIESIKLLKLQSEQKQKHQMEDMDEDINREEMWLLKLLRDKEEDEKQKSWMLREIQRVNDELCQVGAWGQRTDVELSIAKAELDGLRRVLKENENRINEQKEVNKEMRLRDAEQELHRIYNSRSWRMMAYMWKIRDVVLPCGSRRRKILKIAFRILRHPVKTIRLVNMTRIKKLLTEVKNGDWLLLKEQVLKCIGGVDTEIEPIEILTLEPQEADSGVWEDNVNTQGEYIGLLEREETAEKESTSDLTVSRREENADTHVKEKTSRADQTQSVIDQCEEAMKPAPEPEIDRNVYRTLNIPQAKEPVVSIVIPVYNQFNYTYLCIKSIIRNSGSVPYEVIVADDCSTDMTLRIRDVVNGIQVVRTEKNLRFLLNCNNAAKYARGKYILFLNNDTQVQKDWLRPLVDLIERDEKTGMVGSKLIYPDGRLQEAGGILWKDGSAWNYGNRQDPAMPQYNYVKEVDYISGAAIMIRKELWQQLGGFDERFAPAYCEDSDLAFMVREAGYKVLYQPKSVVVHFEGVSNGTDTSSGLKAYQVTNQKKFYEKWKHVLDTHNENAVNVFNARDKSIGRKTILFVDHYVPTYDKDAGSRTVFAYLKMFVEHGFNVKFIGDNFYQSEPYTTSLQQMGVEVIYGSWYAQNWKQWIRENADCFDYAFLNRPHISVNYIDFLRENTKAKIIYYGHDLHFVRVMREYELTGEKRLVTESESWKEKELSLMRKADMSYYPSEVEAQAVHEIDPSIRVKAIPAYLFDDVKDAAYDANQRKDLFFIGGFGHGPNVDAVKWLAKDVMPLLREKLPQIQIRIAGSNMSKEIRDLEGNGLVMEGAVSDERLAELYAQCRLNIVPLRYGAGIKGKVVESMRFGLPVITTSCGAEGIMNAQDCLVVADTAQALAEQIAVLYDNSERLNALSEAGVEYVRTHYSSVNAVRVLNDEFGFTNP